MDNNKKNFYKAVTLITGGNGFIGSHLAKKLISDEAYVIVIVRENSNLWRLEQEINNIEIVNERPIIATLQKQLNYYYAQ